MHGVSIGTLRPGRSVRGRPGGYGLHGLDVFGCYECVHLIGQRSFAFTGPHCGTVCHLPYATDNSLPLITFGDGWRPFFEQRWTTSLWHILSSWRLIYLLAYLTTFQTIKHSLDGAMHKYNLQWCVQNMTGDQPENSLMSYRAAQFRWSIMSSASYATVQPSSINWSKCDRVIYKLLRSPHITEAILAENLLESAALPIISRVMRCSPSMPCVGLSVAYTTCT